MFKGSFSVPVLKIVYRKYFLNMHCELGPRDKAVTETENYTSNIIV